MKILICYFSGTNNTKKIVDLYKECFEGQNCSCFLHKIENVDEKIDFAGYDLLGFAYPVHAFNAPSIVLEFAKKLPEASKKVFIAKTSGEPLKLNNISSLKLIKLLKKKGYSVENEYHYCMPYNIIFRHTDDMAYRMWESAKAVVPIDCKSILDGKKEKLDGVFMGSLLAWIFRIEFWGGRFNGKRYKVTKECIGCNRCVKTCPTKNITIENGEIKFGNKCIMCMRCSFFCPKNAIKIGLFNKWRVNGPYHFQKPEEEEENKHKNYCKKSYKKYFEKCQTKIEANKEEKLG